MAGPYDSVVSIGGQSFLDGLWRLLGPALEGLTNPLPLALPGFANAQMRVTQLVPVFPGSPPATGALILRANVEVTGEALLHLLVESGTATIALGSQTLSLTNLAGPIALPVQTGTLSNIAISGTLGSLTGGTGDVTLPAGTALLSGGTGDGALALPGSLAVPGIPLPAVVPVAVDLTHAGPLSLQATVALTVTGPSSATRFGLLFSLSDVGVTTLSGTISSATLTTTLQAAVDQIVGQLAIPGTITQPAVDPTAIATLVAPISGLVTQAFDDALSGLLAETGRLLYPAAGAGASCDARVLPTAADATLAVSTVAGSAGTYVLQVGFRQAGSTDIAAFPPITSAIECEVLVGNSFILGLMCCLVERLPAFSLPVAATTGTVDVAGATHVRCCNFTGVTANFGGIAIGGGGISVCIDGASGSAKSFSLVGSFAQTIALTVPIPFGGTASLGTIAVTAGFSLPLAFDFDDAASIANLRMFGTPTVTAAVTPSLGAALILALIVAVLVPIAAVLTGLLAPIGALLGTVMSAVIVLILLLLVFVASAVASTLLGNAVRTLLSGASLLRSPIALPPGLFEAFGRFAATTVTVDDLEAGGVLHTPTSVWGLLPRMGPRRGLPAVDFGNPDIYQVDPGLVPGLAQGTGKPGTTQPGGEKRTSITPGGGPSVAAEPGPGPTSTTSGRPARKKGTRAAPRRAGTGGDTDPSDQKG